MSDDTVTPQAMSMVTIECSTPMGMTAANIRALGAALASVVVNGREIVRPDTDVMRVDFCSGVTLAPWPNRLAGAHWSHDGRDYRGKVNEALGNALHGLVYNRVFDLVSQTAETLHLSCTLGGDDIYPFSLRVDVIYAVSEAGLRCTYDVTNLDTVAVPVGLGAHPYFPFDDADTLTLSARTLLDNDERLIPTGRMLPSSVRGVVPDGTTPLVGFVADDCFTDLTRSADGRAVTSITYVDGFTAQIWQDESFPYTQVFTKRDFLFATGMGAAIAIEPQTAPANALQTGRDLRWLQPSERWIASWGIAVASSDRPDPAGSL